jgi:hypothetical protein
MKKTLTESFDELLKSQYGSAQNLFGEASTVEQLLAGYYGAPEVRYDTKRTRKATAVVLSLRCDDGETLEQRRRRHHNGHSPQNGHAPQNGHPPGRAYAQSAILQPDESAPIADIVPAREIEVDFKEITGNAAPQLPPRPELPAPPKLPEAPSNRVPADVLGKLEDHIKENTGKDGVDDDFLSDMKSILSGEKTYDPARKKTVQKSEAREDAAGNAPPRPSSAPNEQAIFDRIAQSMQYANAFDLGTVELENRFADFDRLAEIQKRPAEPKKARPVPLVDPAVAPPATKVSGKEFLDDLDAIQERKTAAAPAFAEGASWQQRYAEPLYDTGEHVLPGENLYKDKLRVGSGSGVLFSYGQLVAMGDLFESADQMNAASPADLQKLKALIERSTAYYKAKKRGSVRDVSNKEWNDATGGRYLKLAEDNYDHFAPNVLFTQGKPANKFGDHKTVWERHHSRALQEAHKLGASVFPEWPLVINAFGDHFLTDAFAAGHVINKEAVINIFKTVFYTGAALTADAKAFFRRVADKAFVGDVAKKFKKLETAQPYDAWWNIFNWNPDINSAERFSAVLIGIAEQEPTKIANLAVKAIHDHLNENGIEVINPAGHAPWLLTGDGHLTDETLAVMKQAVEQSAANITDPALFSGGAIPEFRKKVWQYVPQLTPASTKKVVALVNDYVKPSSVPLLNKAAKIINNEVDTLVKELVDRGVLAPA